MSPQNIPTPDVREFDVRDLAPKGRPAAKQVYDLARAVEHYGAMLEELAAEISAEVSS
jgi:hypothetical protein